MSKSDGTFIYVGTYPDEASAQADYEVVIALHVDGAVGGFDAAVVTKDSDGKIHVAKDETSTRAGAWGGIAVGAVLGILFPPSLLGAAAVGGVAGGVGGHLWKGMSRSDVKQLGDVIDVDQAALVVVGDVTISDAIEKAQLKAVKSIHKEVNASVKDVEKQIKEASKS
jgi:uncharacterized membrane protein